MFSLTPRERKALIFISSLILISIIVQWLWPHKIHTRVYDYTLQDSIFQVLSADTIQSEIKKNPHSQQKPQPFPTKQTIRKKKKDVLRPKSIELNTTTLKELERLPRIGPATAKRIIEYRQANGGFKSVEELIKVKRIGPKTLEKIKPFVYIKSRKDSALQDSLAKELHLKSSE